MLETITSTQNPKIRKLLLLQSKSSLRRKEDLFVVEGYRELEHCMEAGLKIETLFVCEEIAGSSLSKLSSLKDANIYHVNRAVYERIAYRSTTEGVIAEVRPRHYGLKDLTFRSAPLLVVIESVEKPGNLGAMLRSADAAGADAVIICDPLTDLYNPNLIRSSVGGIFSVPCVISTSEECIKWLEENNISILTAQLQDSSAYYDIDMTIPTAIVMGTEATGLSQTWRQAAHHHIRIPMRGKLDSLNVSVSAAILLYEAVRQRECLCTKK